MSKNDKIRIEKLQKKAQKNKENPKILIELASLYLEYENFEAAYKTLLDIVHIDPDNVVAHYNLGLIYDMRNSLKLAQAEYQIASKLSPKDPDIHFNLANVYYKRSDYQKAIEEYSICVFLDPKNADAFYNMGLLYERDNNVKAAVLNYEKALSLIPQDKDIQDRLRAIKDNSSPFSLETEKGVVIDQEKDYSLQDLEIPAEVEVKEQYSNNAQKYDSLGDEYFSQKLYERAKSEYEKELSINSTASGNFKMGKCLMKLGEFKDAVKFFDKALKIDPKFYEAIYFKGRTYLLSGNMKEAKDIKEQLFSVDKKYASDLSGLIEIEERISSKTEVSQDITEEQK